MKIGSEADNTQHADSVASHKKFEEKTIFPLRYCPTQIFLAYRHTMYGMRRKIMGRSAWGWCGQRTL